MRPQLRAGFIGWAQHAVAYKCAASQKKFYSSTDWLGWPTCGARKDRPRRVVPIGCLYLYYMRGIDRVRQQPVQSRFTPALPTTSWHHSATGTAVQGWSRIASDQVQRSEKAQLWHGWAACNALGRSGE